VVIALVVFCAIFHSEVHVESEPPTNLVIQAAEQNKDAKIAEIDELLDDAWLSHGHRWFSCHFPSRCTECGISESEYEEQSWKAWLELHPEENCIGGPAPSIIENLIRNLLNLAWEWLLVPFANIFVAAASCLLVNIVVRKARSKGLKRISTATLGLALGVPLFIVGFVLGPFFECPVVALFRTKLWLQEMVTVLAPYLGWYY
jgi:hypothetical protein